MGLLIHNLIGHPVAGILWALGAEHAGDWVHDATLPAHLKPTNEPSA
jgi:hypothetical protein